MFEMAADQDFTARERADDFAKRHLMAARARIEQRERDRAEVCSSSSPPSERILAWEKMCSLRLPADPEHPVLYVVATLTGLTLAEVREQQRARCAGPKD
jgi:hypothetical protein